MKNWFKSGSPWIWLNGGAVAISLVMVIGLLTLIAVRGFSHFWPAEVVEFDYTHGEKSIRVMGQLVKDETLIAAQMREAGFDVPADQEFVTRTLIKQGNRDLTGRDFLWYLNDYSSEYRRPEYAMVLERQEWGNFYGYLKVLKEDGRVIAEGQGAWQGFQERIDRVEELFESIEQIERYDIGEVNFAMEQLRLEERRLELTARLTPAEREARLAAIEVKRAELNDRYGELSKKLQSLKKEARRDQIVAEAMDGRELTINLAQIVRAYQPNNMNVFQKLGLYGSKMHEFVFGYPREANTEGGIFPAIFGTVMMVLIMSVVVTPLGVLAAIYLREYARQGPVTRIIRISVNNLAGVPSIVFGVFGLGFFVYFLGGNLDQLFYPEALPAPTFGTPGLMWASLTLALLTLPVVIVSTEEGLTRIPRSIREGSLALGATKAETLWKVIVPLSAPAMMTGLILAVARAAGEVAPLMLVGVVKLAPNLPVDTNEPFVHLERKIMHLGFHIYDVGFQSPNVEAARPLVYATSLMLVIIILVLNLAAIAIRNRLREKYRSSAD
ncbi:MAG: phosphate ABC transporter permease PstA [Campylobacterales bacterium]